MFETMNAILNSPAFIGVMAFFLVIGMLLHATGPNGPGGSM